MYDLKASKFLGLSSLKLVPSLVGLLHCLYICSKHRKLTICSDTTGIVLKQICIVVTIHLQNNVNVLSC